MIMTLTANSGVSMGSNPGMGSPLIHFGYGIWPSSDKETKYCSLSFSNLCDTLLRN